MDLSIIVTMYNNAAYARQCLDSLSSLPNYTCEIIIVNDGSTDETGTICKDWASNQENVQYHYQQNSGVSVARNLGLKLASGSYITFVDGDDWIESSSLLELLSHATGQDIVIGAFYTSYRSKKEPSRFFSFSDHSFSESERITLIRNCMIACDFGSRSIPTNCGVPWAKLYRNQFITENGLAFVPGLKRMQDSVFNINAFATAQTVVVRDLHVYNYRISSSSSVNKYDPRFDKTAINVLDNMRAALTNQRVYDSCIDAYLAKSFQLLLDTIRLSIIPDPTIGFIEMGAKVANLASMNEFDTKLDAKALKLLSRREKVLRLMIRCHLYIPLCMMLSVRRNMKQRAMFD